MRLVVINGVNMNMLGVREPERYGTASYQDLENHIRAICKSYKIDVEIFQSNHEGDIIDKIHAAHKKADGIIINAGAHSYTSLAIMDALLAAGVPSVEVHMTAYGGSDYKGFSYISKVASAEFSGEGFNSYRKAIEYFASK